MEKTKYSNFQVNNLTVRLINKLSGISVNKDFGLMITVLKL